MKKNHGENFRCLRLLCLTSSFSKHPQYIVPLFNFYEQFENELSLNVDLYNLYFDRHHLWERGGDKMFSNAKKVDVKIPERNSVNWQLYKSYVWWRVIFSIVYNFVYYYHPLYDTSYVNVVGPTVEYLMTQCSLSSVFFSLWIHVSSMLSLLFLNYYSLSFKRLQYNNIEIVSNN